MTFNSLKGQSGRQPYQFIELDLDFCPLRYGESSCDAKLSIVSLSNLFLRSQELTNAAWTATGLASRTDNVEQNPIDFTTNASRLTTDTSTGRHSISQSVTFGAGQVVPHVVSIMVRPENYDFAYIEVGTQAAFFDLRNRKVSTVEDNITADIEIMEFNYFRCSVTFTPTVGATQFTFGIAQSDNVDSFTGVASSNMIFFGAQIRQKVHGNQYLVTTSSAIADQQAVGTRSQKCFNTRQSCQDPDNYQGRGITFDGVNDSITVSSTSDLEVSGNNMTLEAYIKPTNGNSGSILNYSNGSTRGPEIKVWNGGGLNSPTGLFYADFNGTGVFSDFEILTADKWFHCIATYDNDTVNLYVDGRLVGSSQVGSTLLTTSGLPVNIAHHQLDGDFYDSSLARLRIYNRTFTRTEVKKRFFDNFDFRNGLLLDLTLNTTTSSTTVLDSSQFNHDGLFSGGSISIIPGPILTKTYRLAQEQGTVPIGLNAVPCIRRVNMKPGVSAPGNGIGTRASIRVQTRDFPFHDIGVDKYVKERTYTPIDQGTYFGKLIARNPFFNGRNMRVLSGYVNNFRQFVAQGNNIEDLFQERVFVIETINGPDRRLLTTITGKDPLKTVDDNRAEAPLTTNGRLNADINVSATDLTLNSESDETQYPISGGSVRINDEIMTYDFRLGFVLNTLTRGQAGTQAAEHDADDAVQLCKVYSNENVVDIIYNLLVEFGGVSPSIIPLDDWTTEKNERLSNYNFTTTISEPVGVKRLLEELTLEALISLFWDELTSTIVLKSLVPDLTEESIPLTNRTDILQQSVRVKRIPNDRVSRVVFNYGVRNFAERLENQNLAFSFVDADLSSESDEQYASKRIKTITSRWFTINNRAQAVQTASRLLARLKDEPLIVSFDIDGKDSTLKIGDVVEIQVDEVQDDTGGQRELILQVISIQELTPQGMSGTRFRVQAQDILFEGTVGTGGFARIAPDATLDFTSASQADRDRYGFIADNNGEMSTGEPGYRVL